MQPGVSTQPERVVMLNAALVEVSEYGNGVINTETGELVEIQNAPHRIPKKAFLKLARDTFNASARRPCWICGRFETLTQAHHIFPLSYQWRLGVTMPIGDHEWLCPNHHVAIHILIGRLLSNKEGMSAASHDVLKSLIDEGAIIKAFELIELTKAYLSKDPHLIHQQTANWRALGDALYQHADELERYDELYPAAA